jgi:hypothetical protein
MHPNIGNIQTTIQENNSVKEATEILKKEVETEIESMANTENNLDKWKKLENFHEQIKEKEI